MTLEKISYLNYLYVFILYLHVSCIVLAHDSSTNVGAKLESNASQKFQLMYKTVFLETRLQQMDAVQSILKFQDYTKQYEIVNKTLNKMFEVILKSKVVMENSSYIPGVDFPDNDFVAEALGFIVDSTAMYGEIQLKLPDITDRIMKIHPEWLVLIKWAIGFSNSTGLFDEKTTHMIHLLCQEMNLIERTENFINPYRKYDTEVQKISENTPQQKKKKKLKFTRGPRLSKPGHTEL